MNRMAVRSVRSRTQLPPSNNLTVGTPRTPYSSVAHGALSTSTETKIVSSVCAATALYTGANLWQGTHQLGAVNFTTTRSLVAKRSDNWLRYSTLITSLKVDSHPLNGEVEVKHFCNLVQLAGGVINVLSLSHIQTLILRAGRGKDDLVL